MNLARFPRHPLTFGPTPIHALPRLSAALGGAVELYAKREDCNSGLAFGGNKTRKLEYLIPEALATGCDTLVSIGGIQSNQTRQVAAVAAHLGLKCVLVQENWVNYSDAVYDRVGNIEMSRILGAQVRLDAAGFDIGIRPSWEQAMDDVRRAGGKPFPIPAGCSEHPLGGLGLRRLRRGSARAGGATRLPVRLHRRLLGDRQHAGRHGGRLRGRRSSAARDRHRCLGEAGRHACASAAHRPPHRRARGTRARDRRAGRRARHALRRAGIRLAERGHARGNPPVRAPEGMLTDPVYEGKSMHGMIDMVRRGEFARGSRVLYAHLGGVPALNAYSFLFRNG